MNTEKNTKLTVATEVTDGDREWLQQVKAHQLVTRVMGSVVRMELMVSKIDDEFIHCGPWKFSKETGAEIDADLGWDAFNTGATLQPSKRTKKS